MNNDFNFTPEQSGIYQGFDPVEPAGKKKNTYALASLILGIVSVASCCLCCCISYFALGVMLICGVLAIVFAILSKKESEDKKFSGKALAGLILGIVGVVLVVLFAIVMIASVALIGSMSNEELLTFIEETFKPLMTEEEYAEFIAPIESALESAE